MFCSSSGNLNISIALELSKYLKDERDYVPWAAVLTWFNVMKNRLSLTPVYGNYQVTDSGNNSTLYLLTVVSLCLCFFFVSL